MKYESFEKMINCLDEIKKESDRFNKGLQNLLGGDTYSMYYTTEEIYEKCIIDVLISEFGESKEGADWFVYEGLTQIKDGGTSITENNKKWKIKNIKDYYNYLVSLQK